MLLKTLDTLPTVPQVLFSDVFSLHRARLVSKTGGTEGREGRESATF